MKNKGQIIALDLYEHRLALVEAAAQRLGIEIIETKCADITEFCRHNQEEFDYVLLDVPCSGLGVIRRKPDIKWRRQENDIETLAQMQRQIINAAAIALKPGGTLVYSTCTNEPEETDLQVEKFLAAHPEFAAMDFASALPTQLSGTVGKNGIQLFPHLHHVDGFFIAKLQKKHS